MRWLWLEAVVAVVTHTVHNPRTIRVEPEAVLLVPVAASAHHNLLREQVLWEETVELKAAAAMVYQRARHLPVRHQLRLGVGLQQAAPLFKVEMEVRIQRPPSFMIIRPLAEAVREWVAVHRQSLAVAVAEAVTLAVAAPMD
jgi:hypothetical protein